jgi:hypothetical protein
MRVYCPEFVGHGIRSTSIIGRELHLIQGSPEAARSNGNLHIALATPKQSGIISSHVK